MTIYVLCLCLEDGVDVAVLLSSDNPSKAARTGSSVEGGFDEDIVGIDGREAILNRSGSFVPE